MLVIARGRRDFNIEGSPEKRRRHTLLKSYPKCSQDLNPIVTAWREVRHRLNDTEPTGLETRAPFIKPLHQAVAWVNKNRAKYLMTICASQKAWAKDVEQALGARTKH